MIYLNNKKTLTNFIWRFAERCGAQGVNFIVSIVLARLLSPEDYGSIALVTIFITILNVFVDSGLANALIQKKNADDIDFSSVFYFNVTWCFVLYFILFLTAPLIAKFYNMLELIPVIRVLGLTLIISGIKNVQMAYVSKTMQFKRFFFSTLGGTIFSAIVGIILAYQGYGVWALVAQQLSNQLIDTLILWITVKWRPILAFSAHRLRGLISYGWKLLIAGLLDTVYSNLRQLIIGKVYSSTDLAYYNKGNQLPFLVITNINSSIDSVLFPVLSEAQDNKTRIKNLTRTSIRISSYVIWPIVIGLAACSDALISILLTEKWLPCVPYMQIFCFTYGFWPIHTANLNAIKALGKSDIFLKLEIIKKIIGLVSILISIRYGVLAIALSALITSPISAFINATPNKTLLNYTYTEQLLDMCPSMISSIIMGLIVYSIKFLHLNMFITLILQIVIGIIIYVGISIFTKNKNFYYLLNIILKRKNKEG